MKTMRVLDVTGDTTIAFDETETTAAARAQAEVTFNAWMEKQHPAFMTQRPGGAPDLKITAFGQIEDGAEVLLFKPITAG